MKEKKWLRKAVQKKVAESKKKLLKKHKISSC